MGVLPLFRIQHTIQPHISRSSVWHLDTNGFLSRNRRLNTQALRCQVQSNIRLQRRDARQFHTTRRPQGILRHFRPNIGVFHLYINVKFRQGVVNDLGVLPNIASVSWALLFL